MTRVMGHRCQNEILREATLEGRPKADNEDKQDESVRGERPFGGLFDAGYLSAHGK